MKCALCGNESKLMQSHIIPKLVYKRIRSHKNSRFRSLDDFTKDKEEWFALLGTDLTRENDYVYLYNLKKNTNYIAFRTHNNRLNNECIKCLDILIIEKDLNNLENKLVLVLINDKYRILKYFMLK